MDLADHIIDPGALVLPWQDERPPVGVIDLDSVSDAPDRLDLPPFPLLGIGDPSHPLACQLDAVAEMPISIEAMLRTISENPNTAAVTVQLLRGCEGLPLDKALAWESMAYAALQGSAEHAAWLDRRPRGDGSACVRSAEGRVVVGRDEDRLDLVLDRPEARNAIDRAMRDALFEAFTVAALDADIRSIRLSGVGRNFSMGADLGEFGTTRDPAAAHLIRAQTLPAHVIARCADRLEAHIQGACVGSGLEIAAFARRVTITPDAWFQLPEVGMGIIPGAGGSVSIARRIGRQRAALLMLSGKRITAQTALAWGLADAIVEG